MKNIQSWFSKTSKKASVTEDPVSSFSNGLKVMLKHYGGDHSSCVHPNRKYTQKDALTSAQMVMLKERLNFYSRNSEKFCHGLNQSPCESFNNVIATYAPKNVYVPSMYQSRVNIAVLVHNEEKIETVVDLTHQLMGLPVNDIFLEHLRKKDKAKLRSALHFQTKEKARRKERESKTYAPSSHFYKEDTKCNCVTGCKTLRCSCAKNRNACTELCACFAKNNCSIKNTAHEQVGEGFFDLTPPENDEQPPKKRHKPN